jgi:4'-phosphopantetheinyl transferase
MDDGPRQVRFPQPSLVMLCHMSRVVCSVCNQHQATPEFTGKKIGLPNPSTLSLPVPGNSGMCRAYVTQPCIVKVTSHHALVIIDRVPSFIHLWLADPDASSEALQIAYLSLLDAGERERRQHFRFERDRRRYLVTRALVRTVLSRYAPVAPRAWSFVSNEYGCPRVADSIEQAAHVRFSVSHTHDLIVLAVGTTGALGVDVENVRMRDAPIEIAGRFFAADEVEALRETDAERRQDRFFEYWTFKESYIKARGMGLSLPLDRFGFDLSQAGAVSFRTASDLGDRASRWQFWQFRPDPEHVVALCAERAAGGMPTVNVARTIPLACNKPLQLSFSRISVQEESDAEFRVA